MLGDGNGCPETVEYDHLMFRIAVIGEVDGIRGLALQLASAMIQQSYLNAKPRSGRNTGGRLSYLKANLIESEKRAHGEAIQQRIGKRGLRRCESAPFKQFSIQDAQVPDFLRLNGNSLELFEW
jgi:hypothetical protein